MVLKYDLYNSPNHTTESGTINYVQVFARAKSQTIAQHEDGIYKILITDDACANIYKSDDVDLTASTYKTYNKTWTVNPRTSNAFTWDNIDDAQFGLECSSPSVSATLTTTFRPNAAGDITQLIPVGDAPNWKCVDDIVPDENTTFVRVDLVGDLYDLYNIPNHTTEVGVITNVCVFARVRTGGGNTSFHQIKIKTQATEYVGTYRTATSGWATYSDNWDINPNTLVAWTWADIDALQIGIRLDNNNASWSEDCTQVYAVITYDTPPISPQIRTTQCYAKVNYDTNIECTLDKPEEISVDHDQNIKMLNFWYGDRAVYGLSRNNRTMVMTGKLYSDTACTTIQCIEQLGLAGDDLSLSGLGSNNYDKVVKIISFGWQKMGDSPLAYRWILELEFTK